MATVTWTSLNSGNWSDGMDWSTGASPLLLMISATAPSICPSAQASITACAVVPAPDAKIANAIATAPASQRHAGSSIRRPLRSAGEWLR